MPDNLPPVIPINPLFAGCDPLPRQESKLLRGSRQAGAARARAAKPASAFRTFAERYWSDPVGFARDCIRWEPGEGLTDYQAEILAAIPVRHRVCVRSCHGAGKTAVEALAILWFALTREGKRANWKVVTTASVGTQLTEFLWPEVHLWAGRLRWDRIGRAPFDEGRELLKRAIRMRNGRVLAVNPEQPSKLEGAHADHLLYTFDECKDVPDGIFDAAEGAFSGAGGDTGRLAFALAISTPGAPLGRFYDIQSRKPGFGHWEPIWVRIEQVIAAGRVSGEWIEQQRTAWGETSALYLRKCEGRFAADDESGVISLDWIEQAVLRGLELERSEMRRAA